MAAIAAKADRLKSIGIKKGRHERRSDGMNLLEAAAWYAGEPHGDTPDCVDMGITVFLQHVSDAAPYGQRQRLKVLIPDIVRTWTYDANVMRKRALIAADFAVRFVASEACEAAGRKEDAETLRNLPRIDSPDAARVAVETTIKVSNAAWTSTEPSCGSARAAVCSAHNSAKFIDHFQSAAFYAAQAVCDAMRAVSWRKIMPRVIETVQQMAAVQ